MIPQKPGIYKITHTPSGLVYVGSAKNLSSRWSVHKYQLFKGRHHSRLLQRFWDKYGESQFTYCVVELVGDLKDLLSREQAWIDATDCVSRGFNSNPTAGSSIGRRFSPETLSKMSENRKGRLHTPEAKEKMSMARKGKKLSHEHAANVKAAILRRAPPSDESRQKMSASAIKRCASGRGRDQETGRFSGESA